MFLPRRTKVLSMSFSPPSIPWTENFRCKVTFFSLLGFWTSHWLKFLSSRLPVPSVKRPLVTMMESSEDQIHALTKVMVGKYTIQLQDEIFFGFNP